MTFTRTPEDLAGALGEIPDLVILDLTTPGWDYDALFAAIEGGVPPVPTLGFTTHALAHQTRPLHARCQRVVTRETLTRELGRILTEGIGAREESEGRHDR